MVSRDEITRTEHCTQLIVEPDDAGLAQTPDEAPKRGTADQILDLVADLTLFHDELETPYVALQVGGHREVRPCKSKKVRLYLAQRFYRAYKKAPNSEAIKAALGVLEGRAIFEGKCSPLHNRVAWHDGVIYYDLSDKHWRAVKITQEGWQVETQPPILFRRYAHQAPQVEPQAGGSLNALDPYLNLTDAARHLFNVTLCNYVIPDFPHPAIHPHGEKGAGKSHLLRLVRTIVDPSHVPLLSFPRDVNEFAQQLHHHYAPQYDNVSNISQMNSDILCRAITGDGFSKRELYSDDDDVIFTFRRCVGLNGINVTATAPDLLDRMILLEMERIDENDRKQESDLWTAFDKIKPKLLGAVFDAVSAAMKLKEQIRLDHLPRMADFAAWGEAISRALGNKEMRFISLYTANIQRRDKEVVENHPVAATLSVFMENRESWEGTASELYTELEIEAQALKLDKLKDWPKAPNVLTRRLREVLSNLREVGIVVCFGVDGKNRSQIRIERGREIPPEPPHLRKPKESKNLEDGDAPGGIVDTRESQRNTSGQNEMQNQGVGDTGDTGGISRACSSDSKSHSGLSREEEGNTNMPTVWEDV